MAETPMNIMEQIARLEQELQAKRAELGEKGMVQEQMPGTKELLREVVGEKLQTYMPPQPAQEMPRPPELDESAQAAVDELVNVAFTQDLDTAIKQAVATGNAAIVDAFHDAIVDEFYDEMITQRKIERVPQ